MYHETVQKLLNITDHIEFERMMCDLLSSLEYKGIDPQSPGLADGGKDAMYYSKQDKVCFAFSLRQDWKKKFNEDFENATKNEIEFNKFVFCTNQSLPALERDKIKKLKKQNEIEVDFFDQERIRVALDTDFKKIRQIYLGIQDNSTTRRKIKNILFDSQNEVKKNNRWEMLSLAASLEMIGFFNLIKDEDLSVICETQKEYNLFEEFINIFLVFRKSSTEIDNYMFSIIGNNVSSNFTGYWNKISEYCKLRLLGVDEENTEKIINTWNITSEFKDCKKLYSIFIGDKDLEKKLQSLGLVQKNCNNIFSKIKALKEFNHETMFCEINSNNVRHTKDPKTSSG